MKKVRTALLIVICFGLVLPSCLAQEIVFNDPGTNSREAYDANLFVPASRMQRDHARFARTTQSDGDGENVELISSLYNYSRWGDWVGDVAIAGDYAYLADYYVGLHVIDISDPINPTEMGICDLPEGAYGVAIAGDFAYVAVRGGGLRVVDVSDPNNPTEVGFCNNEAIESAYAVAVAGDYAYVAVGGGGLHVVDVSDPTNLTEVGSYGTYYARDVDVVGDYAYVVGNESGFRVVDVSDPAHPSEAGFCSLGGKWRRAYAIALAVAVDGNYAYVGTGGGFCVVDISDPAHPVVTSYYDTPGFAEDVDVIGDYAYVGADDGLYVVDISNPANPTEVGLFDTLGSALSVAVAGNYAFVGNNWLVGSSGAASSAHQISPIKSGFPNSPGQAINIEVTANCSYYELIWGGFSTVDISDPTHPAIVGFRTTGNIAEVSIAGNYVYLTDGLNGLHAVNVSDPVNPTETDVCLTLHYAYDVAVDGDYAYLADDDGLHVVDISDPTNLSETCSETLYCAMGVIVNGDYAYVTCADSGSFHGPRGTMESALSHSSRLGKGATAADHTDVGEYTWGALYVVDISDPINPEEVGCYDSLEYATDIFLAGNYVYVTSGYGLRVVDVSDPSNPTEVGFYDTPEWTLGVSVTGDYAYVAAEDGLRVVDVSDPANPTEVGFCDTPGFAEGVAFAWDYAYVAADSSGLRVVDVSDPANPVEVGFYDTPGCAMGVAVAGEYIYVADKYHFHILRSMGAIGVDQPSISAQPLEYSIRSVYPNPFNPSTTISVGLPHSAGLKVAVYNLLGREVAQLANDRYQAGYHRFVFDGSGLPSGIYFVRATVPGEMNQTRRVVLIK